MIRMCTSYHPQATSGYLTRSSALREREKSGRWLGQGTQLSIGSPEGSPVDPEHLTRALIGFSPNWQPLQQTIKQTNRRCGFDIVATPPKSVSIAGLCVPQLRVPVANAFDRAVLTLVRFLESLARHRKRGKDRDLSKNSTANTLRSRNLTIAYFRHEASRWNDPHLHGHLFTLNTTCSPRYLAHFALEPASIASTIRGTGGVAHLFNIALRQELHAEGIRGKSPTDPTIPGYLDLVSRFSKGSQACKNELLKEEWQTWADPHGIVGDRIRPRKSIKAESLPEWPSFLSPSESDEVLRCALAPDDSPPQQRLPNDPEVILRSFLDHFARHYAYSDHRNIFKTLTGVALAYPATPIDAFAEPLVTLLDNPQLVTNRRWPPDRVLRETIERSRRDGIQVFIDEAEERRADLRRFLERHNNPSRLPSPICGEDNPITP